MWLLAEIEVAKIIFLSALMLSSGWLLVRTYRQRRRTIEVAPPNPRSRAGSMPATAERLREAPAEFRRWEAEMRDLARTLSAQFDGKIDVLERLMRDAERQITRLEELGERASRLTSGEPASSLPPGHFARPADAGSHGPSGAKASLRADAPAVRAMAPAARRHEEIYALADSGLTSAAIAARIGSPVGEIELILGLRHTRP
ncbi:MAG TPA: hypothetical protein VMV69_14375 [Pirellulales bacterium]|nr:hypothetical protein [Pirellulales bacterium]